MKKYILTILIFILTINVSCRTREHNPKLNLDFEVIENGMPRGWFTHSQPGYLVSLDSVNVQSGRYSILIQSTGETAGFQAISIILPNNYEGQQITLSGYIKTENVTDGYAGLWMRIDPQIAFDNMAQRGVTGTTDWTRHEITLPMNPANTTQIIIGGLLVGKGKMWLDNLSITIDGRDISQARIFEKPSFPANLDREFDNGSNIEFPVLTEQVIDNLVVLGKLWGFLKYHHPEVGKGNYNWDFELFRILPEYLKVQNNAERDQVLLNWINRFGEIPVCTPREETPTDAHIKPDFSWVENSNMSDDLKEKIWEIRANRHQGDHFYVQMSGIIPTFTNENPYSDMLFPDAGFRLLALYRYWNIIQYFFPYKYVIGRDWNDVLREYIPVFLSAKNALEYELAVWRLISEINSTHATKLGGGGQAIDNVQKFRGENVAPFRVRFIEQQWVVVDYFNPELKEPFGPEIGDIITHINGQAVEFIVDSVRRYYPASNEVARMRRISRDLIRSTNNTANIQFISSLSGQTRQIEQTLFARRDLNFGMNADEKSYQLLDGYVGYIALAIIRDEDIPVIKELFKNTRGIIIDIRNPLTINPSALIPFLISEPTPYIKFTRGNINNPGEFTFTPARGIPKAEETFQGKLVVLVNEYTQSGAETLAMTFRAGNNTTIVGSQTAGSNGSVVNVLLPGGLKTRFSSIGVYYPDGTQTQRIGIVPDIEIRPTIRGIREGRDELLEKAIEIIKRQ